LNVSGNVCGPNEHALLVQAAGQNTRLKSIVAEGCQLSRLEMSALDLAVETYRHGAPKRDAHEHRAVSMVSAELRKEVLDRVRTKGLVLPKMPEKKKNLVVGSHRRAREPLEEPIWKRHDTDVPWGEEDIEALLTGPVPLGQSFVFLGRLCSELHDAEAALDARVRELTLRSDHLVAQHEGARMKLEKIDEEKRSISVAWNKSIAVATGDARHHQLKTEQAEKKCEEGTANLVEYEKGLLVSNELVKEFRSLAEEALPGLLKSKDTHSMPTPNHVILEKLSSLNSDLAGRMESALLHRRFKEEALVQWSEHLVPELQSSRVAAQESYSEAKAKLESVFAAARAELSALQKSSDEQEKILYEVEQEALEGDRSLAPALPLLERLSKWLARLDTYFLSAMDAEAWRNSVVTCGNPSVDNLLRNAISNEFMRRKEVEVLSEPVVSDVSEEVAFMRAEDLSGHQTMLRKAEQDLKRARIEHRVVAKATATETSLKQDKGRATPADAMLVRANIPNGGESFRAAYAVTSAVNANKHQHVAPKSTSKRKEIDENSRPRTPLPSMVSELRELSCVLESVCRKGSGPEGEAAREVLRQLTRVSVAPLKHVRRHEDIRKAQLLDEAISVVSNLPVPQLADELEEFGVVRGSVVEHEEMVSRLASLYVDRELAGGMGGGGDGQEETSAGMEHRAWLDMQEEAPIEDGEVPELS
jgi:hypothetical protein